MHTPHHHSCSQEELLTLFPGITAYYRTCASDHMACSHEEAPYIMEINHCHYGRVGWDLNDGTSIYMGEGDVTVHSTMRCSDSVMHFPLGAYEGVTITIDFQKMQASPPDLLAQLPVSYDTLVRTFSSTEHSVQFTAAKELDHIFSPLYHIPKQMEQTYLQLKVQEFILYLMRQDPEESESIPYNSSQTQIIREIHTLLTDHLQTRYTIEELSAKYLINTSSLKEIFKAVYGKPIAAYMKEYRIHHAEKLLRHTDDTIAEIAMAVGYESQSKFSNAFREITGLLPREYRKQRAN